MALFEDLLLLADGRLLFYGEWSTAGSCFDKLGYPCAPGMLLVASAVAAAASRSWRSCMLHCWSSAQL